MHIFQHLHPLMSSIRLIDLVEIQTSLDYIFSLLLTFCVGESLVCRLCHSDIIQPYSPPILKWLQECAESYESTQNGCFLPSVPAQPRLIILWEQYSCAYLRPLLQRSTVWPRRIKWLKWLKMGVSMIIRKVSFPST